MTPHFSKMALDADVVIVGAGPVGLVIALMIARQGISVTVLERFSEEYKIHAALLPQLPLTGPDLGMSFSAQLRKLRTVLAAGLRSGEMQFPKAPADMRARSVFALSWTPENIVRDQGAQGALRLARDTVLRGAARRSG
jgi:glycine/D-amino acid oxidase-like deaminating enzyme